MKKRSIVLLLAVILTLTCILAGCPEETGGVKSVTVYLVNGENVREFTFETDAKNLGTLIRARNTELGISYQESTYGMYISSVKGWEIDFNTQFVSILVSFNTVAGDFMIYTDPASEYNVHYVCANGAECDSATVGTDSLPIVDGATYVIYLTYFLI